MGPYGAWLVKAGKLTGRVRECVGIAPCAVLEHWQETKLGEFKRVCSSFAHAVHEVGETGADNGRPWKEVNSGFKTRAAAGSLPIKKCSLAVAAIHEKLGYRDSISTTEFTRIWEELLPQTTVTSNDTDLPTELVRQGLVLHYGDEVYLESSKVARLVEDSLPSSQAAIVQKLKILHEELDPLESANEEMVKKAYVGAKRILWMGLGGLVAQFLVLFDLTYFVYSWNDTEPVTYFLRYALLIGAYVYLMRTNQVLGHTNFYSWLGNKRLTKLRKDCGFNHERYFHLKEEVNKWERYAKGSKSLRHLVDKSRNNTLSSTIFLPGVCGYKSNR